MPASNIRPPTIGELTAACSDLAADLERFAAALIGSVQARPGQALPEDIHRWAVTELPDDEGGNR